MTRRPPRSPLFPNATLFRSAPPAVDEATLSDGLDRLFPEPGPQRTAAETAVRRPLSIIAGGPGPRKRRTGARVGALHVEQGIGRAHGLTPGTATSPMPTSAW